MKKILYTLSSAALIFTLALTLSVTADAHGHNGGHHSESHLAQSDYYYCDGHEAHLHENDICPYVDAAPAPDAPDSSINYGSSTDNNNAAGSTVPRRICGRQTLRHRCRIM